MSIVKVFTSHMFNYAVYGADMSCVRANNDNLV